MAILITLIKITWLIKYITSHVTDHILQEQCANKFHRSVQFASQYFLTRVALPNSQVRKAVALPNSQFRKAAALKICQCESFQYKPLLKYWLAGNSQVDCAGFVSLGLFAYWDQDLAIKATHQTKVWNGQERADHHLQYYQRHKLPRYL